MKKVLLMLLLVMSLVSCKKISQLTTSTSDLEADVKKNMQDTFREDGDPVLVLDLDLHHVSGDKYAGTVRLKYYGEVHIHEVDVVYDGEEYVWLISDL